MFSGPNNQSFCPASVLSQLYFSDKNLDLTLGSSFGPIFPFSISSASPSYKGTALAYNLLCLFGDFDMQT